MDLSGLLPLLWHLPDYGRLAKELRGQANAQGPARAHAPPVAWPYVLAGLYQDLSRPMLVVVPGVEEAKELRDQLESWCRADTPVLLFPEPDALPYERLPWDSATCSQRLRALAAMAGVPRETPFLGEKGVSHTLPQRTAPPGGSAAPTLRGGASRQPGGFLGEPGNPSSPKEGFPAATPVVVASAHALMAKTMPAEAFRAAYHTIEVGMKVAPDALMARWVAMGYGAEHAVEVPGTFSRRGGILDVFSPHSTHPLRIEFFGDEIESLRLFDPATQRSLASVRHASLVPARELVLSPEAWERLGTSPESSVRETSTPEDEDGSLTLSPYLSPTRGEESPPLPASGLPLSEAKGRGQGLGPTPGAFSRQDAEFFIPMFPHGCLLDYVPPDGILVLADPDRLRGEVEEVAARSEELREELTRRGELPRDFPRPYWDWPELAPRLQAQSLSLSLEPWAGEMAQGPDESGLAFVSPPSYGGQLPVALAEMASRIEKRERVVVVSHQARRLSDLLAEDHDILAAPREAVSEMPPPGSLTLVQGGLSGGFVMVGANGHPPRAPRSIGAPLLVLLTDSELFGLLKQRRQAKRQPARHLALSELNPSDYVVHVDHGIGRFAGTTTMEVAGTRREYLLVEYAQGDKLYVPIDQMDRIGPYYAVGGEPPALSRLGGGEWARAKEKAAESAAKVAKELLDVYATRELLPGIAFSPDSAWQQELESSFPFVETPDQLRAVQEVKADMQSARPMDRLVCGDVGYGKTEVALRAAFKAVSDGYQVGVLVPTTVLAQQHFQTFRERLAPFPVKVDVLSRFRSPKEQDEVLSGLAAGAMDIVIGTHRLLQKDVVFKKLGLVVIDEEHRFGVLHKERLKQMRREVDVLSMSATPIPRTLYMSLVSVRDMSTMETPPEERLPIKTYVSPYKEELVREAILRELDRGGQVFFVHNRVHDIQLVARHLEELVPEARTVIGHGQMPEEELETVMLDFASGKADVLVCTTIIEAGLDLPNANTLIIYPADKLGLAQLYQLRGRVGRGRNRAYAYLLFDRSRPLTDTARKRLGTIRDATELGAGFRIAMKDLEIRGAGNLLGTAQHGHIAAVGFDLYCRMLVQAVEELRARLRGEPPPPPPAPSATVDLPLTAHIPEDYVPHLPSRLLLYQRLARPLTPEEIEDIRKEWQDRFGPLPEAVDNLLYMVRVKTLATQAGFYSVAAEDGHIVLRARERLPVATGGLRFASPTLQGVTVGTTQVRLDTSKLGASWPKALEQVLASLAKSTA